VQAEITRNNHRELRGSALEASEKAQVAEKARIIDTVVVVNFTNAVIEKNQEIVNYYLQHLRPEFSKLLREWLATEPMRRLIRLQCRNMKKTSFPATGRRM